MKHNHLIRTGICLLTLAGVLVGCRKQPRPVETLLPWFEDVTEAVGLDFAHDPGSVDARFFMPQIAGSGAALFDFDGDGRLDIYLLNNGGPKGKPNRLFKQNSDGTFKDVSRGSGLDFSAYCQGIAVGDINNDGLPDLLVTEYQGIRLFLNQGNGTFADVTAEAGLHNPLWATSAAFVDYDRDGWLDLVVANYLQFDPATACTGSDGERDYCHPKTFPGTVTKLFRNLGKTTPRNSRTIRFEDVTIPSRLAERPGPGLGVLCADFDGDGWPDIFIANDAQANHLWINQKNGTFKEEAVLRGVAYNVMGQADGNMGVGWGDVDGDGLQDLFVTHLKTETNTLWKQGPRGMFQDRTASTGLHRPTTRSTGFGTILSDFDNNGALDVAIANGAVVRTPSVDASAHPFWGQYTDRNQIFANDGAARFRDLSLANGGPTGFCGQKQVGRGLAVGDIANNGALWLLTTSVGGPPRLFRNVVIGRGHWLVIRAYDPTLKRDAIGAEIIVRAGERSWIRTVQAGGSYLCSSDPRAHFGLGKVEHIESIHILWPDGRAEQFSDPGLDCHLNLQKGKGKPIPSMNPASR